MCNITVVNRGSQKIAFLSIKSVLLMAEGQKYTPYKHAIAPYCTIMVNNPLQIVNGGFKKATTPSEHDSAMAAF